MEIRVQSIKFDADQKLLEFIETKLSKLTKYYDEIEAAEVSLSLSPGVDNKCIKVRLDIPGYDILVERKSETFEDALMHCIEVLKEQLKKRKGKEKLIK